MKLMRINHTSNEIRNLSVQQLARFSVLLLPPDISPNQPRLRLWPRGPDANVNTLRASPLGCAGLTGTARKQHIRPTQLTAR